VRSTTNLPRVPPEDDRARRLVTIPGIGVLSATALVAAIGDGGTIQSPSHSETRAGQGRVGSECDFRASDTCLTRSAYRIELGSACRAKPQMGAVSRMVPPTPAAPLLSRLGGQRCVPEALRRLRRIGWRDNSPRTLQHQHCCGLRFDRVTGGAQAEAFGL
jgi:hypothetical protein